MAAPTVTLRRSLSIIDLGSLLYLGAVWGAVYLFMRIAAPQVGPLWAADIRLLVGAGVLLAIAGRRTWRAAFALAWASIALAEPVGPELVIGFGLIFISLCLVLGIVPAFRRQNARRLAGALSRA
jgi:hypothetical protein